VPLRTSTFEELCNWLEEHAGEFSQAQVPAWADAFNPDDCTATCDSTDAGGTTKARRVFAPPEIERKTIVKPRPPRLPEEVGKPKTGFEDVKFIYEKGKELADDTDKTPKERQTALLEYMGQTRTKIKTEGEKAVKAINEAGGTLDLFEVKSDRAADYPGYPTYIAIGPGSATLRARPGASIGVFDQSLWPRVLDKKLTDETFQTVKQEKEYGLPFDLYDLDRDTEQLTSVAAFVMLNADGALAQVIYRYHLESNVKPEKSSFAMSVVDGEARWTVKTEAGAQVKGSSVVLGTGFPPVQPLNTTSTTVNARTVDSRSFQDGTRGLPAAPAEAGKKVVVEVVGFAGAAIDSLLALQALYPKDDARYKDYTFRVTGRTVADIDSTKKGKWFFDTIMKKPEDGGNEKTYDPRIVGELGQGLDPKTELVMTDHDGRQMIEIPYKDKEGRAVKHYADLVINATGPRKDKLEATVQAAIDQGLAQAKETDYIIVPVYSKGLPVAVNVRTKSNKDLGIYITGATWTVSFCDRGAAPELLKKWADATVDGDTVKSDYFTEVNKALRNVFHAEDRGSGDGKPVDPNSFPLGGQFIGGQAAATVMGQLFAEWAALPNNNADKWAGSKPPASWD
jgi:hypothetical protein